MMTMSLRKLFASTAVLAALFGGAALASPNAGEAPASDPATVLWYAHPADK